ncbi:MAG: hypothetical protein G01um101433_100 [Parcubacteria group bacterium Gr01-1014_33]|nr:MAG: hypothetical protein G01um101433_100 [Parcubacteria group bacterium Gr01-1014_33]
MAQQITALEIFNFLASHANINPEQGLQLVSLNSRPKFIKELKDNSKTREELMEKLKKMGWRYICFYWHLRMIDLSMARD